MRSRGRPCDRRAARRRPRFPNRRPRSRRLLRSRRPTSCLLSWNRRFPNVKGKTFTSATWTSPPAARSVPHRHGNAFVYAYVLEGTVRSQLGGEQAHTYRQP